MLADALTDWLLLFHLIGAFVLVSGSVVAGVAFEAARRRRRPSEVALQLGLSRFGVARVGLGSLLIVPFALWLVHATPVGYDAGWVDAALALFLLVAALGTIGGQTPKRARLLAQSLDDKRGELTALLNDRSARLVTYASSVFLLAIIVLTVFKPGGPGS